MPLSYVGSLLASSLPRSVPGCSRSALTPDRAASGPCEGTGRSRCSACFPRGSTTSRGWRRCAVSRRSPLQRQRVEKKAADGTRPALKHQPEGSRLTMPVAVRFTVAHRQRIFRPHSSTALLCSRPSDHGCACGDRRYARGAMGKTSRSTPSSSGRGSKSRNRASPGATHIHVIHRSDADILQRVLGQSTQRALCCSVVVARAHRADLDCCRLCCD